MIVPAEVVNVAVVAPVFTETEAGTVSTLLAELVMVTLVPAAAALLSVMVQVVDAFEPREAAVHFSPLTRIGATRETDADFEEPFRLAVTDALWSDGIVPADAVKLAVVVPAATLTEAGTVRIDVALLDNKTVVAFAGALERVTVHCVVVFCVSVEAVHCNAETVMGTSVTVTDWLVPFRVAERWAVPDAVKAVLLAAKVALVAFAATVTEVRTVRLELSEDRVTVEANVAATLNVTVHVNEADGPIEFDPQETVLGVGRTAGLAVTVPEPPVKRSQIHRRQVRWSP